MRGRAINRLGDLERAVMDEVWAAADRGAAAVSVREVHEQLAASRDLAYTTVMTVMGRLSDKGLLTREKAGRAFRYSAAGTREELTADTMREQLVGMDTKDRRAAMLHFLGGRLRRGDRRPQGRPRRGRGAAPNERAGVTPPPPLPADVPVLAWLCAGMYAFAAGALAAPAAVIGLGLGSMGA